MKKFYFILFFIFAIAGISKAQGLIWTEGFENSDTANLPAGWANYNNLFPQDTIDPTWNWTVRVEGASLPGLQTSLAVVHSGTKSVGVSWYSGPVDVSDAWLVTKKISNCPSDGLFNFWITGGSTNYGDSVQIWISPGDSTPSGFLADPNNYIQNIWFPAGSVYGNYTQFYIDLSPYSGQNIFIGFRYHTNTNPDGYFVQLDDVTLEGTVGISQLGTNVPDKFSLSQNYPNPFNPTTKINFDLAKSSNVKLTVFNSLGQMVKNIFEGYKPAGTYTADFNAGSLSSGTYYYRLETDFYTETKKMLLVK
jgi:Secretion system C-terminal sorting domain